MCGIWGQFIDERNSSSISHDQIFSAIARLAHRGPDGYGYFYHPRAALAHTRLSIIDLAGGAQPFYSFDERFVGVVNGEIYNYQELRAELLKSGISFRTQSDSEVLLNLFARDGARALSAIQGEFAFIFFDQIDHKVYFGRDPHGVKPLFMQKVASGPEAGLKLASEAKALVGAKPTLNQEFWKSYLARVIVPGETIFEGIEHVLPGRLYCFSPKASEITRTFYQRSPFGQTRNLRGATAQQTIRESLQLSVKRRLVADVSVGCYLSGGIDSALVASLMVEQGARPKAFTVGFENSKFDETQKAAEIARHLGISHHVTLLNERNFMPSLEKSILAFEQPIANVHGAAKNLLSELAAKHVKVVLSGEGADEYFGGYAYLRLQKLSAFLERHPRFDRAKIFKKYLERGLQGDEGYLDGRDRNYDGLVRDNFAGAYPVIFARMLPEKLARFILGRSVNETIQNSLAKSAALYREETEEAVKSGVTFSELDRDLLMSTRFDLLSYILANLGDRQEMSNSIEGRTPFLDKDLVHQAARLHPTELVSGLCEKSVLKQIAAGYLPPARAAEPKQAFFAPNQYLFSREGNDFLETYSNQAKAALPELDLSKIDYLIKSVATDGAAWEQRRFVDGLRLFLASTGLLVEKIAQPSISLPASYRACDERVVGLFHSREVPHAASF